MIPATDQRVSVVIPIVAGIGNALMCEPMVRQIAQKRPAWEVTVLATIDAMGEVFRRVQGVNVVITGGGSRGRARMVREARTRRADYYLVPFPSNRWQYNMLAATSRAYHRIIHSYPVARTRTLSFLPAIRVPAHRGLHDVVQNLNLLTALHIEPELTASPMFPIRADDEAGADAALCQAGVDPSMPLVAIHPGSAKTVLARAKRWAPEQYAKLIARLGGQVVVMEGPDEAGVGSLVLQELARLNGATERHAKLLVLRSSLGTAAAVLKKSVLYIGSDSGLAHLAGAVGTPPVTLFAPADPERVSPHGWRHLVVRPDKPCSPCMKYPWECARPRVSCREPLCISEITVEMVLEAVQRVKSRPAAGNLPAQGSEAGGQGENVGARQ